MLQGLRPGDNVVWQVATTADYAPFVSPFRTNAIAKGRRLIYFRFAGHPPLLSQEEGVEIHRLNPEIGFEKFISGILHTVEVSGEGTCYVFDCLSELAADWYSDRMLGNFFLLVCPQLFRLNTYTYFALLRNAHSAHATDAIEQTAQVLLNVYRSRDQLYVQPLKVAGRYSATMYMLHAWEPDRFRPVTSSAIAAEIFAAVPQTWTEFGIHRPGIWTRTFAQAQKTIEAVRSGRGSLLEIQDSFQRLLRMAISRDERFIRLAKRYFSLSDLAEILQRMIGTGLIGGKSLGMFLARAILRKADPYWSTRLEAHDCFSIGSDVFCTCLVQNGCWDLHHRQEDPAELMGRAAEVQRRIMAGAFPEYITHQFAEVLDYYGQSPVVVRSSSLLEDSYGDAFSGHYETTCCPNQGSAPQRLDALVQAVRQVYASTMGPDALRARQRQGLLAYDEQMAILLQRVSGQLYGDLFFPHLAGVGYSCGGAQPGDAPDAKAGTLQMVLGLGTRGAALKQAGGTDTAAFRADLGRPAGAPAEIRSYPQREMDVLDLGANRLTTRPVGDVPAARPAAERLLRETDFLQGMAEILRLLQDAYQSRVQIEFTANALDDGTYRINVLQCRPHATPA